MFIITTDSKIKTEKDTSVAKGKTSFYVEINVKDICKLVALILGLVILSVVSVNNKKKRL